MDDTKTIGGRFKYVNSAIKNIAHQEGSHILRWKSISTRGIRQQEGRKMTSCKKQTEPQEIRKKQSEHKNQKAMSQNRKTMVHKKQAEPLARKTKVQSQDPTLHTKQAEPLDLGKTVLKKQAERKAWERRRTRNKWKHLAENKHEQNLIQANFLRGDLCSTSKKVSVQYCTGLTQQQHVK